MRSLAIITRLTRQRSTSTPASGPMIATGSMYETNTTATSAGVPWSLNVIRLMTAKMARKSPKIETNCAIQMVRKAGCWRTLGTRFHNTRATLDGDGLDQDRAADQGPGFRPAPRIARRRERA